MIQQTKRKVKLHTKYRDLAAGRWPSYRPVPWLNVSGVWLERAGFRAGDAVEITVAENQLVIKNCSVHADRSH
jgi:toxic protein SymE